MKAMLAVCAIAAIFAGIALAWRYSALRSFADVAFVASVIAQYAQSPFAPLLAVAAFVLGGLVVFPVLVLIVATAVALGPWMGFLSASAGTLLSGLLLFSIGRGVGQERLQRLLGRRARRIQDRIVGKGILAVVLSRMVPVAPFSIVNVVAGASKLSLRDFAIGTALGMIPGNVLMAVLGSQVAEMARNASWSNVLLFGLAVAGWIAFCLCVQLVATRLTGEQA
jgi:phospholipase D1/2